MNYLDDYLFAAALKRICDNQIKKFLMVCNDINFPVALAKTFWGEPIMVFLGLLLDAERLVVCIPLDKLNKAINWVEFFLNKKKKKATVLEFQKLCGILNFLCRCIIPGRAFLRRLYVYTTYNGKSLKPHHHVKIIEEHKLDSLVWQQMLLHPDSFYRPFMEAEVINATELDMYSDASGNYCLGFGAYCGTEWTFGQWDQEFCERTKPSIEYLEMFAVLVGVLNWLKLFKNCRIVLFCDNQSVVHMINNSSSSCKTCMVLIRLMTAECMFRNTRVFAKHVGTKDNGKADALSRLDFRRFWDLSAAHGPMNEQSTAIPKEIWPIEQIWRY